MITALTYVFPVTDILKYRPLARRFVETYMAHPPGEKDHQIYILVNGGVPARLAEYQKVFSPLVCRFIFHNNVGYDLGAFAKAATTIECDLMVCIGSPVYFHRAGWLDRIIQVYERYGPGMYGCWGFKEPALHLRTTIFWMPPELLNSYPYTINTESRYEIEHGKHSLTMFTKSLGLSPFMVTWDGCYPEKDWHHVERAKSLVIDQHLDLHQPA